MRRYLVLAWVGYLFEPMSLSLELEVGKYGWTSLVMHQPLDEGAEGAKGGTGGYCDCWIPEVQGWTGRRRWNSVLQEGLACCSEETCPTYSQCDQAKI